MARRSRSRTAIACVSCQGDRAFRASRSCFIASRDVILSTDPATPWRDVFGAYVDRRSRGPRISGACHAAADLKPSSAKRTCCSATVEELVGGDELYHVRFPFVKRAEGDVRPAGDQGAASRSRQPNRCDSPCDDWRNVVGRLREFGTAPDHLLFVLRDRASAGHHTSAPFDRVRNALDAAQIPHLAADALPEYPGLCQARGVNPRGPTPRHRPKRSELRGRRREHLFVAGADEGMAVFR